ncbi:MAG: YkgJ family cysteine cluster protein [Crocinitomicaceae bacterium]|jgi:Fe-S-cluster containining protein
MSRRKPKNSDDSYVQLKKKLLGLKKMNSRKLDELFHSAHEKEFRKTDCLSCANCCKTTSPIFRDVDINRISKRLGMKSQKFIEFYLRIDEDQDYVLHSSPCTFLNEDNTCSIYEDRPLACREYPHTDRKNMYQILDLTAKNILVCPAVEKIVEEITNDGSNVK